MTEPPGYVLESRLRERGEFTVHRGRRRTDSCPVLVVASAAEGVRRITEHLDDIMSAAKLRCALRIREVQCDVLQLVFGARKEGDHRSPITKKSLRAFGND